MEKLARGVAGGGKVGAAGRHLSGAERQGGTLEWDRN